MPKSVRKKPLFRETAVLSGIVQQEQILRAVAELRGLPEGVPVPLDQVRDEELASKLVEMGVITAYQADQLAAGRTKLNLGPYTITDWIGQGGMGQVFKAVHTVMGRACAIKVLPLHKSTPEAIENFRREIRTQAQLDHPHLVRAYDAGHDGNVHYLVTEYVAGTDLRQLVRRQGPLTMQQAAKVIVQAAQGLDYAHRSGLIHRDVKPGNILVTPDGVAKVSDLGLSAFMHEADDDPRAGKIVGTADYLSPEQIHAPAEVTAASDIYSLGCTFYYAISGKVPFPGGSTKEKARRHMEETPWHPRRFNPEVSEEFVEIIADMMEKNPRKRTSSAAEVVARLDPWARQSVPLPPQQLTKSPWMPPPLPTSEEGMEETQVSSDIYEDVDSRVGSASQVSQSTAAILSGKQETHRIRRVVPPPLHSHTRPAGGERLRLISILAIAIPLSMLAGSLVTLLISEFLRLR